MLIVFDRLNHSIPNPTLLNQLDQIDKKHTIMHSSYSSSTTTVLSSMHTMQSTYYAYYYSRVLLVLVASIRVVFILEYSMHNMQNNYYSLVVLVL